MPISLKDPNFIRDQLLQHPIYKEINTTERMCIFMNHHVFAVWDFMSLLKALQRSFTCVNVPWMPNPHPEHARFINEIVLGEECDENGEGGYCSHFELYLRAMEEIGANTTPISEFLQLLQSGIDPAHALDKLAVPSTVKAFVNNTLHLSLHGQLHEITSAFFFGREDLIPDMFTVLLNKSAHTDRLTYYLQRHIELDGDHHGPLAEKLLSFVCQNDPLRINEANHIAQHSLQLRIHLWDGVLAEIREKGI